MATAAVTADGRARVLADGNEIPLLALTLSPEDMAALDALDKTGGSDRALEHNWW